MPIKEFKSKIFPWFNEPKWLSGLALYFGIGAAVIIASHLAFSYLGFLHTDVDSARYMLSALVQGEAAIVALVVTLSLVAVQLAAQSYSARVIEVFRRTPDLWILMGIYGVAIFYGLGVLKMIERANPQLCANEYICLSNLEGYISGAYYLGVFAFLALAPYFWKMLEMLKPSTVINMLAEGITAQKILSSYDEGIYENRANPGKDPIQPIIDIIRGSLMKYDYETVREGLRAIGDRTNFMFAHETFDGKEEEKLSTHIFRQLLVVVTMAARKKDEGTILEVILTLESNGRTAAKFDFKEATARSAEFLGYIGNAAAEHKFEGATLYAIDSLSWIGIDSTKYFLEDAVLWTVTSLKRIGITAVGQKFKGVADKVASNLRWIEKVATEQNLESASRHAAESREAFDKLIIEKLS